MKLNQKGMTFISLVFLLSVGGFVLMIFFQMFPIYLNNFKLKDALFSLKEMPAFETFGPTEIKHNLERRFNIGSVENIDVNRDIKITKEGNHLSVKAEYEVVKPIIGNVSILMYFNEGFEIDK